ncbi:MAG: type III pantothenate kinase [Planctomycetes bacterium]|nr:type III pantothenate kinase [Planctomycetota bacterium]MDA8378977.1 type III pantothenate kinase [Planctomycetia bacterium]
MSVIAIDIGNTRVGVGLYTNGKSADPAMRFNHAEIQSEMLAHLQKQCAGVMAGGQRPADIVLASVAPEWTMRVTELVNLHCGMAPKIIGTDLKIPLQTHLTDETSIGVDRLLSALAAYVNTEQACAIINAGTALVVDGIDADGVFLGGAIAPGLAMTAKALHTGTAQLPLANLEEPTEPFGRNTMEALNLGAYAALRGSARYLLERYAEKLGHWPHVVATGGDAMRLFGDSGLVDSFIPDLVLQGAALVWEHHQA